MAYEPKITLLWGTPEPAKQVYIAARLAMVDKVDPATIDPVKAARLVQTLYKAGHHAALEHACASLLVRDVSRAFMSQITRHRHLSFTCTSQHYQDYQDFPLVHEGYDLVKATCVQSVQMYEDAIIGGMPKWEARQMLPNAMGVNMVITANATAWAHVLRMRQCMRNVPEMHIFAHQAKWVLKDWFSALFELVKEPCNDGYLNGCREPQPCNTKDYQ